MENRSVTPTQMDVGVRYEPLIIIRVYDVTLGVEKPICEMYRTPVEMSVGFGNQVLDLAAPTPPPELYEDGYTYFTRTDEKTWVLDVDAWFLVLQAEQTDSSYEIMENYVKLSLKMTISQV